MKKNLILIMIVLVAFLAFISMDTLSTSNEKTEEVTSESDINPIQVEEPKPVHLMITAVGDIMTHGPQLKAQYDTEQKTYNFTNNYRHVKEYIAKADLAFCNIETVFGGEEKKYSSYPRFNTPDTLADALLQSGFDIAVTANNHSLDQNVQGLYRTLDVLISKGLTTVGTQQEGEKPYTLVDIKDIKVGVTAYTYETARYQNKKTINGLIIPTEVENSINTFNYNSLEKDLLKMKSMIHEMKEAGSELIIFYMHWGQEYSLIPTPYQKQIAQYLADNGVHIIFGSHPHVIQPAEILDSQSGNKAIVFYSLGNFISNQRFELMNSRYSEDGMIAQVECEVLPDSRKIIFSKISIVPTWVNKYHSGKRYIYEIVPLPDFLKSNILVGDALYRAENSYRNTMKTIGEEYSNKETMELILLDNSEENEHVFK